MNNQETKEDKARLVNEHIREARGFVNIALKAAGEDNADMTNALWMLAQKLDVTVDASEELAKMYETDTQ